MANYVNVNVEFEIQQKSPRHIAEGFFIIEHTRCVPTLLFKQLFCSQFKVVAAVHPGVAAARVVEGVLQILVGQVFVEAA